MYFAVQAMAAELSTGALVMFQIKSGEKITLVATIKAISQRATGRITFVCKDGHLIKSN
jgi:hypothetical protein